MTMPDQKQVAPQNIILCGFMGTGKTTIGQVIAATLGWQFADTDHVIETRQGKTISQIFWQDGESTFRQLETALCLEISAWRQTVIATGGGIVLKPENREALTKAGLVVCLDASPELIAERLAGATDRPLLAGDDPIKRIRDLMAARFIAYKALHNHVDTAGQTPQQLADEIIAIWKHVGQVI
jgi:shikimate kinase